MWSIINNMSKPINNQRTPEMTSVCRQIGFTYIGLLALIAMIAVASAATVTVAELVRRRAAEDELLYVGGQYIKAFMEYDVHTPNQYPQRAPLKLEDLLKDPRQLGTQRYLRQVYPDPMTGKPDWQLIAAPGGGIMGVKSASCARTIKRSFLNPDWAYLDGKPRYCDWVFAYVIACGANCRYNEKPQED